MFWSRKNIRWGKSKQPWEFQICAATGTNHLLLMTRHLDRLLQQPTVQLHPSDHPSEILQVLNALPRWSQGRLLEHLVSHIWTLNISNANNISIICSFRRMHSSNSKLQWWKEKNIPPQVQPCTACHYWDTASKKNFLCFLPCILIKLSNGVIW